MTQESFQEGKIISQFEEFDRQTEQNQNQKIKHLKKIAAPEDDLADEISSDLFAKISLYKKEKTTLTAINIVLIVLQFVNLVGLILLSIGTFSIANRPLPTLVQLTNGEVVNTAPLGNKQRTRAVLQRFVVETLTNLMTWEIRPESNQVVSVKVKDASYSIPLTVWRASFAFSEDFRPVFLSELISLILPQNQLRNPNIKTAISFYEVSIPKKIGEGIWEISVVSDIIIVNDGVSQRLPFSKVLKVKAVDTPPLEMLRTIMDKNSLQQDIFIGRQYGLEIVEMRDLV